MLMAQPTFLKCGHFWRMLGALWQTLSSRSILVIASFACFQSLKNLAHTRANTFFDFTCSICKKTWKKRWLLSSNHANFQCYWMHLHTVKTLPKLRFNMFFFFFWLSPSGLASNDENIVIKKKNTGKNTLLASFIQTPLATALPNWVK